MSQVLKLIAPVQVELSKPTEVGGVMYEAGETITLEKHTAIRLVRKGRAKQHNDVQRARSANDYVLVDAAGEVIPFTEHGTEKAKAPAAPAPVAKPEVAPAKDE